MNLIFLKYATASEIANLIKPFLGEGAFASTYEAANLLILEDNSRSMRRTMELIGLFDSDQFAGQRVRLFEVENSRPSDLQKDLDQVFKAYALSEKGASVRFIPVDRINTIIAVAPNPGIFTQVESWIGKLDIAVKASAGAVNSYVYRLKYARAETVAMAIMALYSGNPMALMALSAMANSMNGMGGGGSMYGNNGMQGGMGMGMGAYSAMGAMSGGMYPGMGGGQMYPAQMPVSGSPMSTQNPATMVNTNPADQTGMYLGNGGNMFQQQNGPRVPHVIPKSLRQHDSDSGNSSGVRTDFEPAASARHSSPAGIDRRQDLRSGSERRLFGGSHRVSGKEG